MHLVHAHRVIARPLAIIHALAKLRCPVVNRCSNRHCRSWVRATTAKIRARIIVRASCALQGAALAGQCRIARPTVFRARYTIHSTVRAGYVTSLDVLRGAGRRKDCERAVFEATWQPRFRRGRTIWRSRFTVDLFWYSGGFREIYFLSADASALGFESASPALRSCDSAHTPVECCVP